jgi:hypothetical protein
LPPWMNSQYDLIVVCLFSGWAEAFPIMIAKKLLENMFSVWCIHGEISINRGPHFTGQVTKRSAKGLWTQWHHHCPYHPQSSEGWKGQMLF